MINSLHPGMLCSGNSVTYLYTSIVINDGEWLTGGLCDTVDHDPKLPFFIIGVDRPLENRSHTLFIMSPKYAAFIVVNKADITSHINNL